MDGITGVANAFIIMVPILSEPLISPVDFHHLQATARVLSNLNERGMVLGSGT